MKNFRFLFIVVFITTFLFSCQKDNHVEDLETNESVDYSLQNNGEVDFRSYEEEDCGSVRGLCIKCLIKPEKPVLALAELGGENGLKEGIDNNFLRIEIGSDEYILRPANFFGENSQEYVISTPNGNYVISNIDNDYVKGKATDATIPKIFENIFSLDFKKFKDGELDVNQVQQVFGQEIQNIPIGDDLNGFGISILDNGLLSDPSKLLLFNPCEGVTMAALVLRYKEILGMNEPHSNAEQIIEDALFACMPMDFDPRTDCIDTQCVMSEILANGEISGSAYAQFLIKLNYLDALLGLDEDSYQELQFFTADNENLINEIYAGLSTDLNLDRCEDEDCGLTGGYHELIIQTLGGEELTTEDKESLLTFFSVMRCDDRSLYQCFRRAQQNPDGDVANYLNQIKEALILDNLLLLDGCDNLANYSDRWFDLAELNPNDIPAIKNKLEQLGNEYWIQTIENAQPDDFGVSFGMEPYFKWWLYTPVVNMDFFGLTINSLPDDPATGQQFSPQAFFNYIQLNFTTEDFLGDDNGCGPSFNYINANEQTNWTDGDAVTTVMTIKMPDDGNVIAIEHIPGEYWTFSTLNAPGWFDGLLFDDWDGYHPVSGNRRFGLINNLNGSYTFYTSGVDRLTGWWHALADATPAVDAFGDADDLWACVLGNVETFVNTNGGIASSDYDCTTVRPDWEDLRFSLTKGCLGFTDDLENFPCKQAEPCQ